VIYPQRTERALDDIWQERVLFAEKSYHSSKAMLDIAMQDFERSGDPDGLMQAQDIHENAVARYMHVLHVFQQLVVNGERPAED
jgi:hypothetical protein